MPMVSMHEASGCGGCSPSSRLASRAGRGPRRATRRPGATPVAKPGKTPQSPPAGTGPSVSRLDRVRALLIVALVACAALPYLDILTNGFVYDDGPQVLTNPYVKSVPEHSS